MRTRIEGTKQYTCKTCERKYAVRDVILTGTLSPEQLRRRGGRREGICHCGTPFDGRFRCSKNVKWNVFNEGFSEETDLFRVRAGVATRRESPQFRAMRRMMQDDPRFADSVLGTAEAECERMLASPLDSVRDEAAHRLKGILRAREDLRSLVHEEALRPELIPEMKARPSEASETLHGRVAVAVAAT